MKVVRSHFAFLFFTIMLTIAASSNGISIHTRDSLSMQQGSYASIRFFAEPTHAFDTKLPLQYRFTTSGSIPPGMKLEPYPCNKPGMTVCPQVASTNGVFLDGTPTQPGSYRFILTAINVQQKKGSREFLVTVGAGEREQ